MSLERSSGWNEAAEYHRNLLEVRPEAYNCAAIVEICEYAEKAIWCRPFYVEFQERAGLVIRRMDGAHPKKCFRVQPIIDNQIEFAMTDQEKNTEGYFMPHAKHHEALDRFKQHLGELDWSSDFVQHRSWLKRLLGI